MRTATQLAAIALAALCARALQAQQLPTATKDLTTWAWRAPSSVVVTDEGVKAGAETTTPYRIEVTPAARGGGQVRYRDLRFLAAKQ
jgi:hypothetical protein